MRNITLYIYDRYSKEAKRVGDNPHDGLYVDSLGNVRYHNLQNGDGTCENNTGGYIFLPSEDGCICAACKHRCKEYNCSGEECEKFAKEKRGTHECEGLEIDETAFEVN